jgi:hypothetical protein
MTQTSDRQRVQAVLQIRLDGAEVWDVAQHIADAEQATTDPWTVAPDAAPLTAEQIAGIIRAADALIVESVPGYPPELAKHIAQRRSLFARAVQSGEIATAARLLKDIAQMEGICPAKSTASAAPLSETKAALLLEIHRRHLAAIDVPIPDDATFEFGTQFSAVQWFACAGDDAARMRWTRAMAELIDDGLVIEHRAAGAKWPNVRFSDDGQAITAANDPPTLKITG